MGTEALHNLLDLPQSFPIEDATEALTVEVTQLDCDLGRRRDSGNCAFVVASKRQLRSVLRVEFLKQFAYLIYPTKAVRYRLSDGAQQLIADYDDKNNKDRTGFALGQYLLLAPRGVHKLGSRHKGQGGERTGTGDGLRRKTAFIRGREVSAIDKEPIVLEPPSIISEPKDKSA